MRLDVYVNYRGRCEDAFRFYEQHLGGRLTGIVRHGEQPNPNIPPDWNDKVLHARIEIAGTVLMGADIPQSEPMRSAYLSLTVDSEADAERLYGVLTDGGEVFMRWRRRHSPIGSRCCVTGSGRRGCFYTNRRPRNPRGPIVAGDLAVV